MCARLTVKPSRSRDRSVHIRFETKTKQLQSTASNVVAELRVYKKFLPMRAIARMMVAGCYSSDVIVGLQAASGEVVSRLVLSARDLATSSWVPFHNLSGVYNGWVLTQSEQEMILKIAILSGSCNSTRVVLNAFAGPFAEHHSPVLLLYSNDSTNDVQARNVDSSSPNRLNDHRLARDVAPGACRLQFHHVSAWERVDRYIKTPSSQQVNLSDYFHDIVEPSQYSISYCAGTCDSAPDVGTRTWVLFSEHQRDPSTVPPLCCVPERYTSLTVLVQRDDTTFLETLLNFAAKSCHCV